MSRSNQILTYDINVMPRSRIGRLRWIGDQRQTDLIQAWLEQEFHPAFEQEFPLDFYSNFHGPETVL